MLVGPGGRPRTDMEFGTLLAAEGLSLTRTIATAQGSSILEAVPRQSMS
jgi:hypothetical protein